MHWQAIRKGCQESTDIMQEVVLCMEEEVWAQLNDLLADGLVLFGDNAYLNMLFIAMHYPHT